jgi:hypothetical protein
MDHGVGGCGDCFWKCDVKVLNNSLNNTLRVFWSFGQTIQLRAILLLTARLGYIQASDGSI